jgi:hypothetical protein
MDFIAMFLSLRVDLPVEMPYMVKRFTYWGPPQLASATSARFRHCLAIACCTSPSTFIALLAVCALCCQCNSESEIMGK